MDEIKKIIEKQNVTVEELINCFEKIKQNGDIAMIKFDGERSENHYTALITFSSSNRDLIRSDENSFNNAMISVLKQYIK